MSDDDTPCTCCDGTGITIQTERRCACQPPLRRPLALKISDQLRENAGNQPFPMGVYSNLDVAHHWMRRAADKIDELEEALLAHTCWPCPACGGDCASANPPMINCPVQLALKALREGK